MGLRRAGTLSPRHSGWELVLASYLEATSGRVEAGRATRVLRIRFGNPVTSIARLNLPICFALA